MHSSRPVTSDPGQRSFSVARTPVANGGWQGGRQMMHTLHRANTPQEPDRRDAVVTCILTGGNTSANPFREINSDYIAQQQRLEDQRRRGAEQAYAVHLEKERKMVRKACGDERPPQYDDAEDVARRLAAIPKLSPVLQRKLTLQQQMALAGATSASGLPTASPFDVAHVPGGVLASTTGAGSRAATPQPSGIGHRLSSNTSSRAPSRQGRQVGGSSSAINTTANGSSSAVLHDKPFGIYTSRGMADVEHADLNRLSAELKKAISPSGYVTRPLLRATSAPLTHQPVSATGSPLKEGGGSGNGYRSSTSMGYNDAETSTFSHKNNSNAPLSDAAASAHYQGGGHHAPNVTSAAFAATTPSGGSGGSMAFEVLAGGDYHSPFEGSEKERRERIVESRDEILIFELKRAARRRQDAEDLRKAHAIQQELEMGINEVLGRTSNSSPPQTRSGKLSPGRTGGSPTSAQSLGNTFSSMLSSRPGSTPPGGHGGNTHRIPGYGHVIAYGRPNALEFPDRPPINPTVLLSIVEQKHAQEAYFGEKVSFGGIDEQVLEEEVQRRYGVGLGGHRNVDEGEWVGEEEEEDEEGEGEEACEEQPANGVVGSEFGENVDGFEVVEAPTSTADEFGAGLEEDGQLPPSPESMRPAPLERRHTSPAPIPLPMAGVKGGDEGIPPISPRSGVVTPREHHHEAPAAASGAEMMQPPPSAAPMPSSSSKPPKPTLLGASGAPRSVAGGAASKPSVRASSGKGGVGKRSTTSGGSFVAGYTEAPSAPSLAAVPNNGKDSNAPSLFGASASDREKVLEDGEYDSSDDEGEVRRQHRMWNRLEVLHASQRQEHVSTPRRVPTSGILAGGMGRPLSNTSTTTATAPAPAPNTFDDDDPIFGTKAKAAESAANAAVNTSTATSYGARTPTALRALGSRAATPMSASGLPSRLGTPSDSVRSRPGGYGTMGAPAGFGTANGTLEGGYRAVGGGVTNNNGDGSGLNEFFEDSGADQHERELMFDTSVAGTLPRNPFTPPKIIVMIFTFANVMTLPCVGVMRKLGYSVLYERFHGAADKSHYITKTAYMQIMQSLIPTVTVKEAEKLFACFERTGRGDIDVNVFLMGLQMLLGCATPGDALRYCIKSMDPQSGTPRYITRYEIQSILRCVQIQHTMLLATNASKGLKELTEHGGGGNSHNGGGGNNANNGGGADGGGFKSSINVSALLDGNLSSPTNANSRSQSPSGGAFMRPGSGGGATTPSARTVHHGGTAVMVMPLNNNSNGSATPATGGGFGTPKRNVGGGGGGRSPTNPIATRRAAFAAKIAEVAKGFGDCTTNHYFGAQTVLAPNELSGNGGSGRGSSPTGNGHQGTLNSSAMGGNVGGDGGSNTSVNNRTLGSRVGTASGGSRVGTAVKGGRAGIASREGGGARDRSGLRPITSGGGSAGGGSQQQSNFSTLTAMELRRAGSNGHISFSGNGGGVGAAGGGGASSITVGGSVGTGVAVDREFTVMHNAIVDLFEDTARYDYLGRMALRDFVDYISSKLSTSVKARRSSTVSGPVGVLEGGPLIAPAHRLNSKQLVLKHVHQTFMDTRGVNTTPSK